MAYIILIITIFISISKQGTFVLIDHHFPPIVNMDSPEGMEDTIKKAKPVCIRFKKKLIIHSS